MYIYEHTLNSHLLKSVMSQTIYLIQMSSSQPLKIRNSPQFSILLILSTLPPSLTYKQCLWKFPFKYIHACFSILPLLLLLPLYIWRWIFLKCMYMAKVFVMQKRKSEREKDRNVWNEWKCSDFSMSFFWDVCINIYNIYTFK